MTLQLQGDPWTNARQPDQLGQRNRILHQKRQIGGSFTDSLNQLEHPLQRGLGVITSPDGLQQQWHQLIQTLTSLATYAATHV